MSAIKLIADIADLLSILGTLYNYMLLNTGVPSSFAYWVMQDILVDLRDTY